jgi:hypothetical protein
MADHGIRSEKRVVPKEVKSLTFAAKDSKETFIYIYGFMIDISN